MSVHKRSLTHDRSPSTAGAIAVEGDDRALDEISDTPLFPINTTEFVKLAKIIGKSSAAAGIASLSTNVNAMICLKFVGELNDAAMLAGASLANTWASAFCLGIILSINLGFSVFASQAYGAGSYRRLGLLYQRNLFVSMLVCAPLVPSLIFADSILAWIGLDAEVSMYVGIYLRHMIPSLFGLMILETTKTFLMAQNIFTIAAIVQVSTAVLNYVLCYLLVNVFEWSLPGVAIAKSITDLTGAAVMVCYAKYSGKCDQTFIPLDREAIQGWVDYFKGVFVIGANLYVEWISFEVSIMIIGAMNDKYVLGAHGLQISIQVVCFTLALGNIAAMQTYIGNAVGSGSKNKAQKVAVVSLTINIALTLFITILLLGYHNEIAATFTKDPKVQPILNIMLTIYGFSHIVDSYACHFGTILRSVGKEREVLIRFVFTYIVFGLTFEWIAGITLGYGFWGVWIIMVSGWFLMMALMLIELKKLDWDDAIEKIRIELSHQHHHQPLQNGEYIEMKEVNV